MRKRVAIMSLVTGLLSLLQPSPANSRVIHKQKSLYQDIVVTEQDGRRCLVFNEVRGDRNQTCQFLDDDPRLVFPYVRMSLAGLLVTPHPEHILVVGLGGGSVPSAMRTLYPQAQIDVVELDPAVVDVAKEFFHFQEDEHMHVTVADARVFIKRAGLKEQHYDFILLDAFNGDYIPEHLMTKEFLQETKALLSEDGVLVANTFSSSRLYDHESVTYRQVFGPFYNFKQPRITGNRVIIASRAPLPDHTELNHRAQALADRLLNFDVDIRSYPEHMSTTIDWDTQARPLTDQYAPANLLQGR